MLTLRPHVVTADTNGLTVLLDARSGRYWQLNQTGSTALRALLAGRPPAQVAADIAAHSHTPETTVATDIATLIHALITERLATDE
ncbi:lasso peptide biosynthesis PqqD family chaperone [Actinocorallia sp. API 0066]|uniref:lasso peptide biosynthesis PqqD family chaperone n=1 Tax=Actinocorallia sp. API 0066 TaxID=2896846 RepID=UPI001E59E8D1|nr:lasso peptide biosynthesis PqqD family chaperone [Actinocorallia sp. API 0066]MCD0449563.1 lasso peptide biosynthesis PqqD family chaperone [Actinocorallia sp. API 0066]